MLLFQRVALTSLLFSLSLAGCAAKCVVNGPPPAPTLVYPASGTSGVPDSLTQIVVSAPSRSGATLLSLRTGQQIVQLPDPVTPPSPVPTPSFPYPPRELLFGVALPALSPATTYGVYYLSSGDGGGCGSLGSQEIGAVQFGSFTTQ